MKMGFLSKNNARKGMGGKGVFKKGVRKECSKRERKWSAEKRERKRRQKKGLQNSRILKRMAGLGGNSQILKAGETLFKNFRTVPRCAHNVNKSE